MKENIFYDLLTHFIEDNNRLSLLIDGPWGCGKTHMINNFIKKFKNEIVNKNNNQKHIVYVSLFGLESLDEIHTAIYKQLHPNQYNLKKIAQHAIKGMGVISKVVELNIISIDYDTIDFQLRKLPTNFKCNSIIVFDDLERLSSKIGYENLLGYINNLFAQKCKVICLISSNKVDIESKFYDFKEKIFDSVCLLNETNFNIFNSIFAEFNIENIELLFDIFENNIRMAKKTYALYKNICEILEKNNIKYEEIDIPKSILFKATSVVIKLSMGKFGKVDCDEDLFKYYKSIFGDNIAYGIIEYFHEKNSPFYEDRILKSLTLEILFLMLFNNNNLLLSRFNKLILMDEDILSKDFFCLSDLNKEKYFNEIEKDILKDEFDFKNNMSKIGDIVKYSDFIFSEDVMKKISRDYLLTYNTNFETAMFHFNLDDLDGERKIKAEKFISRLKETILENIKTGNIDSIDKFKKNKDYKGLYRLIEKLMYQTNEYGIKEINDILLENNFFLPDLSLDIDSSSWSYCHLIAKYSKKYHLQEKFIEYAIEECSIKHNNKSLLERYYSLIFYNIDREFDKKRLFG